MIATNDYMTKIGGSKHPKAKFSVNVCFGHATQMILCLFIH